MNTVFLIGTVDGFKGLEKQTGHLLTLTTKYVKKTAVRSIKNTILLDVNTQGCGIRNIKIGSTIAVQGQLLQEEKDEQGIIVANHIVAVYQSSKNINSIEVVGVTNKTPKIYEKKKLTIVELIIPVKVFSHGKWERKKTYIKVAAWNSVAGIIEKHVKNGTVIGINGFLDQGYPDKNLREINVKNIHLY